MSKPSQIGPASINVIRRLAAGDDIRPGGPHNLLPRLIRAGLVYYDPVDDRYVPTDAGRTLAEDNPQDPA